TQDVKDQNREIQRRSRARRAEVMNDLKKQVEAYQQQGATASLEMQKVAQAVAFENRRLRNLLKIHGVSQDDVERYIAMPSAPLSDTQASSHEPGSLRCRACGSTSIVAEKLPVALLADQSRVGSNISQEDTYPQPSTSVRSMPILPDKNIAIETVPTADHSDVMETSCDTAASILVDLHHHADTQRARAALGCKGPNSCTVNNIKIFQLLE
ncbi:hypothetical protein TRIATDRAFT_169743, partial [Trichoderma atroviride IMI 206040]